MAIKKFLLIIGIALIFAIFFGYAMEALYVAPEYPNDKCMCYSPEKVRPSEADDYYLSEEYQTCQKECNEATDAWNKLMEKHNSKSFIILAIISIAAILAGLLINLEAVSSGILGGGILLLIYSVIRYWGILNKYVRLGLLGAALIILLYYGYKKVDKAKKR